MNRNYYLAVLTGLMCGLTGSALGQAVTINHPGNGQTFTGDEAAYIEWDYRGTKTGPWVVKGQKDGGPTLTIAEIPIDENIDGSCPGTRCGVSWRVPSIAGEYTLTVSGNGSPASVKVVVRVPCHTSSGESVTLTRSHLCAGETTSLSVTNANSAYFYRLLKEGNQFSVRSGRSSVIWDELGAGEYQVQSKAHDHCTYKNVGGRKTITATSRPVKYPVTAAKNQLCPSETTSITLTNSQAGVAYQLQNSAGDDLGSPQSGSNGRSLTWNNISTPDTYRVIATTNVCAALEMSNSVSISGQSPGRLTVSPSIAGKFHCPGTEMVLTAGGGRGYAWEWRTGDTEPYEVLTPNISSRQHKFRVGVEDPLSFRVSGEVSCKGQDEHVVTIAPFPVVQSVRMASTPADRCQGAGASTFAFEADAASTSHRWSVSPSAASTSLNQSTGVLDWDASFVGAATVKITSYGDCGSSVSASTTVEVLAPPSDGFSLTAGDHTLCAGATTFLTLSGYEEGMDYTVYKNGSAQAAPPTVSGAQLNWNDIGPGTYEVKARRSDGLCEEVSLGSTTINSARPGELTILVTGDPDSPNDPAGDFPTTPKGHCPGDEITLVAHGGVPGTYMWVIYEANSNAQERTESGATLNYTVTHTGIKRIALHATELNCGTVAAPVSVDIGAIAVVQSVNITSDTPHRCQGRGSSTFSFRSDHASVDHEWRINDREAGIMQGEDEGKMLLTWNEAFAGTVEVTVESLGFCRSSVSASTTVEVLASPSDGFSLTAGDHTLCAGTTTFLTLSGYEEGMDYTVYKNGSAQAMTPTVSGAQLSWNTIGPGTYEVKAKRSDGWCEEVSMGLAEISLVEIGELTLSHPSPYRQCDVVVPQYEGHHTVGHFQLQRPDGSLRDYEREAPIQVFEVGAHQLRAVIQTACGESFTNTLTFEVLASMCNAIRTYTFATETNHFAEADFDKARVRLSTTYVDGLGRPAQTVARQASPADYGSKDLVSVRKYDGIGRPHLQYLPYSSTGTEGTYDVASDVHQPSFYTRMYDEKEAGTAFYETGYAPSPLNKVAAQYAPGSAWSKSAGNKPTSIRYHTNGPDDEVILFFLREDGKVGHRLYEEGSLYKTSIDDEDGNQTIEYTNKAGLVVLRKSYEKEAGEWASTYYLYDDFDLQRVIFPPEATARLAEAFFPRAAAERQQFLDRWCYQYEYDHRRRMTRKKGPGTEPVRMVYDRWDRLALTQDGNQRAARQWQFIKYDALNRPIMTGLVEAYAGLKEEVEDPARTDRFETHLGAGYVPETHYTDTSHPRDAHIVEYHTITYYDSYAFVSELGTLSGTAFAAPDELTLASQVDEFHLAPRQKEVVKGQVTGTRTKLLGASEDADGYLESILYYDDQYRVIQVVSENHLGGVDRISTQYDFGGNVRRVHRTHSDGTRATEQLLEYDYDHADRLLSCDHTLNDGDKIRLYTHAYNERGELVKKNLHEKRDGAYAQTIDYAYNIRGWLTSINDANLSDGDDLFGMNLHYTRNPVNETNTHFNGNISAMQWSAHGGRGTGEGHAYDFSYDGLNRLTAANYHTDGSTTPRFDVADIGYDRNGNILHLTRWGLTPGNLPGVMDDLSYTYRGNQLLRVSDTGGPAGFRDGNTSGDDYGYDANGNMTFDANKGITNIEYNHLNLPTRVEWASGQVQETLYDASGMKLQKRDYKAETLHQTIDYVDEFVYVTEGSGQRALQLIQHEEGRLVPNESEGTFDFQYHITDHLGNVRITFSTTPENYTMKEDFEGGDNGFTNLHQHTDANANTTTPYASHNKVGLLQSGETGAMVFLSMNKGDTIDLSVNVNYETAPTSNNFLSTAYSALFGQFDAVYGSGIEGGVAGSSGEFDEALAGADMANKGSSNNAPRAFLNYICFDDEMNYVRAGFKQLTTAALRTAPHDYEQISLTDIIADREGYILAYLSNENREAVNIFFDDMEVYHGKTNVVFASSYYPFGHGFSEFNRMASVVQRFRYNSFELDENTGWYDYLARQYDPLIGRFTSVDPAAELMRRWSTYAYAFNNPIRYTDPDGRYPIDIITRSYAPFKSFGPDKAWHGDNRGHSLARDASYRTSATINYDTETYRSSATGGRSYSSTIDGSKGAWSETTVRNRSKGGDLDVHSYGNNAAVWGSPDIDQFTKLSVTTDGDIKGDHILNISGTISGDDFPNQESFVTDAEGNSLWLGNFETSGDQEWGPVKNLWNANEGDVNINVNLQINVNSDGVFQSVIQGDNTISIDDWNKQFDQ